MSGSSFSRRAGFVTWAVLLSGAWPGSTAMGQVDPSHVRTDPGAHAAAADTFRDEAARELIRRARAERGKEAAGLASWEATVRERISVGLTTQDIRRERGLYTSERVGRIRWDSTGVETIRWFGIRRAVPIAGDKAEIEAESPENLTDFPIDPAGDRLVLAGSPFHHPLASGAELHYRYSSGDTMKVILPSGMEVVLAEVRIEPRVADFEALAGSLWFDLSSAALVRGAFRPARPFDLALDEPQDADEVPGFLKPIIVRVETMIVEYALYDLQWWLPTRVRFDGDGQVGSLFTIPALVELFTQDVVVNEPGLDPEFPVPDGWTRSEIQPSCPESARERRQRERAEQRDDAEVERAEDAPAADCEFPNRARRVILMPPEQALQDWFETDEADELADIEPFTNDDLNQIRDRVEAIALPRAPAGESRVRLAGFRYNRVEALSGGVRADLPLNGRTRFTGEARIGIADLVPNLSAALIRRHARGELALSGYWRLQDVGDWGNPFGLLPSASALLLAYDDAQYYRVVGASAGWRTLGAIRTEIRAFAEEHRDAPKETDASLPHLLSDVEFPDNVAAEAVTLFGAAGRIRLQAGRDPDDVILTGTVWAEGALGDRDYARYAAAGSLGVPVIGWLGVALEASAGSSAGTPPTQRHYYLGGAETLRGFPNTPDANQGTAFWLGRLEIGTLVPLARVILFGDIGWAGPRAAFTFEDPAISAGIGASVLDGLLRLDIARSLRGRDPDAWRVYLSVDGLI